MLGRRRTQRIHTLYVKPCPRSPNEKTGGCTFFLLNRQRPCVGSLLVKRRLQRPALNPGETPACRPILSSSFAFPCPHGARLLRRQGG